MNVQGMIGPGMIGRIQSRAAGPSRSMEQESKLRDRAVNLLGGVAELPVCVQDDLLAPLLEGPGLNPIARILDRIDAAVASVVPDTAVAGRPRRPATARGIVETRTEDRRPGAIKRSVLNGGEQVDRPGQTAYLRARLGSEVSGPQARLGGDSRLGSEVSEPLARLGREVSGPAPLVAALPVDQIAPPLPPPGVEPVTSVAAQEQLRRWAERSGMVEGWDQAVVVTASDSIDLPLSPPVQSDTAPPGIFAEETNSNGAASLPTPTRLDTSFSPAVSGLRGLAALSQAEDPAGNGAWTTPWNASANTPAPEHISDSQVHWPGSVPDAADFTRMLTDALRREARRHGIALEDI